MALPKIYNIGTLSVANGATAVTGVGTAWFGAVKADDYLEVQGLRRRIASVTDNTHLVLASGWPGTAVSGGTYEIAITFDGPEYLLSSRQLISSLSTLLTFFVQASSAGQSQMLLYEDTDNGANFATLQPPALLSGNRTWTGPDADMTFSAFMAGIMNSANGAAAVSAIGAQPLDADLTAIAALATTSFGRALLTAASRGDFLTAGNVLYDLGTIADDAAVSVNLGLATEGATCILQLNTAISIIFTTRVAASATGALLIAKTTTSYTVFISPGSNYYAGTTGTDGQLNIGGHSSGVLTIENRTGGATGAHLYVFKKTS